MRKFFQTVSVLIVLIGIAGVGGAVDLATDPKNALLLLIVGLVILYMSLGKEKT